MPEVSSLPTCCAARTARGSCDQQVYADTLGQKRTRSELYVDFFASLVTEYGSDDRYYKVDGKPVFMMESMHEVYVSDCQAFFKKIREGVMQYASFIEPTKPDYGNGMGAATIAT